MPRQDAGPASGVERFFQLSLLGLVAAGYLAVAATGFLDKPTIGLTGAGLLLRGLLICGLARLSLSDRFTAIVTTAYAVFFGADYFLLSRDFLAATVHLLFFLAVMKILTARSSRDHQFTAAIALLELLTAAILSVNFTFFFFLALYLLFAVAALASGEIRRSMQRADATARTGGKRFHPRLALLAVLTTMAILTITAGLFFVLPRTAEAAFSRLAAHGVFLPGFSNQVNLGEIGEIKTSSLPVMHIRIWSALAVGPMKWRGAALSDFDGKRWSNPGRAPEVIPVENEHVVLAAPGLRAPGRRVNYRVEMEALENDTLFFAGIPETLDLRARALYRSQTAGYRLGHPMPRGFHYDVYGLLDDPPDELSLRFPPPVLPLAERELFLQLPVLDGRIVALASRVTGGANTDLEKARAIERHLRAEYAYTLELPQREVADPLAHFLFTRRKGHCEYFASSMAVMLRTLGIPARLATGFQSGVFNPVNGLWLVRAGDAHSWVEAWIPGHGWATFDPTPPGPNTDTTSVLSQLALYFDAAETFWREWVVAYDLTRQSSLAYRLEQTVHRASFGWFDSSASLRLVWDRLMKRGAVRFALQGLGWAGGLLALGFAIGPLVRLIRMQRRVERVRRGEASVADATLLYRRMLHILKRRGFQKPVWFTPAEFAASLPRSPLGEAVSEFTGTYNALRFGGHAEAASKLSILLDRMERG
jgi:transglutaminase-like putative cysteine protease